MSTTTMLASVIDSAMVQEDLQQLLDALRVAERGAEELAEHRLLPTWRWEKVLERRDLLVQSLSLARARLAMQAPQGAGR